MIRVRPLTGGPVAPIERKKGQSAILIGMIAVAASVMLRRFDLDFLSGVLLGISLASFFLGFRAFYRR